MSQVLLIKANACVCVCVFVCLSKKLCLWQHCDMAGWMECPFIGTACCKRIFLFWIGFVAITD